MNVALTLQGELTRRSVEDAIERLMSLLDAIEGDPDLEGGWDDEASDNGIADRDALELNERRSSGVQLRSGNVEA